MLLLGCPSQFSLFIAANFLLFRVAILYGKSIVQTVILEYFLQKENQIQYFNSFD